jgi:hypothetical protein
MNLWNRVHRHFGAVPFRNIDGESKIRCERLAASVWQGFFYAGDKYFGDNVNNNQLNGLRQNLQNCVLQRKFCDQIDQIDTHLQ